MLQGNWLLQHWIEPEQGWRGKTSVWWTCSKRGFHSAVYSLLRTYPYHLCLPLASVIKFSFEQGLRVELIAVLKFLGQSCSCRFLPPLHKTSFVNSISDWDWRAEARYESFALHRSVRQRQVLSLVLLCAPWSTRCSSYCVYLEWASLWLKQWHAKILHLTNCKSLIGCPAVPLSDAVHQADYT